MKNLQTILKFSLCLLAAALFFSLGSCEKPYELKLPLSVSQRNITLTSEGGDNHILIYSTGDWTVGFDREIDWGSLNKTSGSGNGYVVFSFAANYGISRKVTLRIASGSLRDSVVISQKGTMTSATMSFPDGAVSVADTASTITVPFSTNLLFASYDFSSRVAYYYEDGSDWDGESWVSNVFVSGDSVSFDAARNKKDLYRRADLTVYVEDADGNEYGATLAVTQIPAGISDSWNNN